MDFSTLAHLAGSHSEARILQVAVSLGIFDALAKKSLDAPTIASSLRIDRRAAELFANALAAMGLLAKEGSLFSLTPISSTHLIRTSPGYFGDMVLFESSLWDCWRELEKTIRFGRPARTPNMYQDDPQETERFINAMHSLVEARGDARVLTDQLDLRGVTDLLDIGSGPGTYPVYFCRKHPGLKVTIFDLPGTLKVTKRFIKASGLENRISLVSGDYRVDPIPGGFQIVFLSNIIHAESDEANSALMAKAYQCLDRGGRIVIKDHILDDSRAHPPAGAIFSLLMLLTTEYGKCYSFNEVKRWLEEASFKRVSQILLPHPLISSLVVGVKE